MSRYLARVLFAMLALAPSSIVCYSVVVPAVSRSITSTTDLNVAMDGDGTWYGGNCGEEACWQSGACAFVDYTLPSAIDGSTCVAEVVWNSSYHCGGCVSISYGGKKIIAMITNKTGGDAVHLDMTPNTFAQLADKSLGEIDIEWEHVACPITTPLQIRMHAGASQYWFAATVENAVLRTASLDVSTDSGSTWRSTTRNTNNFFELSSASGTSTVWTRATSELGDQVVVKNVVLTAGTTTTGTSNYPSS